MSYVFTYIYITYIYITYIYILHIYIHQNMYIYTSICTYTLLNKVSKIAAWQKLMQESPLPGPALPEPQPLKLWTSSWDLIQNDSKKKTQNTQNALMFWMLSITSASNVVIPHWCFATRLMPLRQRPVDTGKSDRPMPFRVFMFSDLIYTWFTHTSVSVNIPRLIKTRFCTFTRGTECWLIGVRLSKQHRCQDDFKAGYRRQLPFTMKHKEDHGGCYLDARVAFVASFHLNSAQSLAEDYLLFWADEHTHFNYAMQWWKTQGFDEVQFVLFWWTCCMRFGMGTLFMAGTWHMHQSKIPKFGEALLCTKVMTFYKFVEVYRSDWEGLVAFVWYALTRTQYAIGCPIRRWRFWG